MLVSVCCVVGNVGLISNAQNDSGFDAEQIIEHMREVFLELRGMTCSSCVGTVERALNALPFVETVPY